MKPSCKNCKYWDEADRGMLNIFMRCHRFPESVEVTGDHWCGEFKSKTSGEKEPKPRVSKEDMDLVVSTYKNLFQYKFNATPTVSKVDYAAAKKMILEDGKDAAVRYINAFFANMPKWNLENRVFDLRVIPGLRNKLAVASAPGLVVDIRQFLDSCSEGERHSRLWPEYADYVKKTGKKISMKDWVKEVNG